jgi:SAM-dependent methyltransferase
MTDARARGPKPGWVKDTRFGAWLVNTDMWIEHVLRVSLTELIGLLGKRADSYPVIVDVGCGTGKALPVLAEAFAPHTLVGIDPDPALLARAGAAAGACRCRVDLRIGEAAALDLPDASVDLIFCHQTFHHLRHPQSAAREFHRVLKPGAVLLFAESCAPFIRSLLVRLLFRHPMDAQMHAEEYVALLRDTGFEITADRIATPYPWWSRPDVGFLEWIGRPLPAAPAKTVLHLCAFKPTTEPAIIPDASTSMPGGRRRA